MALDHFDQEALEQCSREAEFKTLLFTLCYFHAVVTERRHFGAQGWNRTYPFSAGDLTISVNVLLNYIESSGNSGRVPWEDLRYLLGEIMYGGHVTDDWDRRLTRAYLEELLQPDLLDGELLLAPNFPAPPNRDYSGYQRYIDESLPPESTYLYGLHPNAEIGILTRSAGMLCRELLGLQPRQGAGVSGGAVLSKDDRVKQILDEILEKLPDEFPLVEICSRLEEKTPFMVVIVQECERVNGLLIEAKRSLRELDKGLKVFCFIIYYF
jgi:dynein heavy chain